MSLLTLTLELPILRKMFMSASHLSFCLCFCIPVDEVLVVFLFHLRSSMYTMCMFDFTSCPVRVRTQVATRIRTARAAAPSTSSQRRTSDAPVNRHRHPSTRLATRSTTRLTRTVTSDRTAGAAAAVRTTSTRRTASRRRQRHLLATTSGAF